MKRTLRKLPERSDKWRQLGCSAHPGCLARVEYVVSYAWRDTYADKPYCREHADRFRARWLKKK